MGKPLGSKCRQMGDGLVAIWCPGCDEIHMMNTDGSERPAWTFNGNGDAPTFTPSILMWGKRRITDDEHSRIMAGEKVDVPDKRCHSFVTDGRIQFLGDCTHALAGQTVPLPDFPV